MVMTAPVARSRKARATDPRRGMPWAGRRELMFESGSFALNVVAVGGSSCVDCRVDGVAVTNGGT